MVEVAFPDMRGLLIYYGGTVPGVYSVVLRGGGGFFSHAKIIRDGSRILWCGGSVFSLACEDCGGMGPGVCIL